MPSEYGAHFHRPSSSFNTKPYWAQILSNPTGVVHGLGELESAASELLHVVQTLRAKDTDVDIDEMIGSIKATLERASAFVCELSNGSRPINRLPTEILQHIFSLVPERRPCVEERSRTHWPFGAPVFPHLEVLTQVCKHWYELVAEAPTLWSTYRDTPHGLVKPPASFAIRFPIAPIDIYSEFDHFSWSAQRLIRVESHRIRQIHFYIQTARIADTLLSILATLDFACLEHCSLELPSTVGQALHDSHAPLFTVGTASRLRSLFVRRRSILPIQQFHSLTRLVLFSPPILYGEDTQTNEWDLLDLLKLLAEAPKLEVIHLREVPVRTLGGTQSRLPRVLLKHLRYLSYDSNSMDVPSFTALISNIHIPVHCRVFVDYIPFSVTPSSEIFSLIRSLPGDISSNCTCMGIHFRACTLLEAKLELPTIIPGFNGRRGVACGGACVVLREVNREEVDRFWDFICARAVMERLEEVRINIDNKAGWAGEWTARILSSLVNVRRLALSFQDPICKSSFRDGPFNVVLAPLGPFKTATLELACPDLQDLDIYVDTSEYQPAMEAIANMLARRAARNKPVRRLVLYAAEPVDSRFDLSKHVTEYTLRIIMFPTNWTPLGWGEWPHVPDDNLADGGHEPIGMDWTTW